MMNEKKPWLNENGDRRSEGEIRSLAEKWGDKTWEEFLKDTVEKPLKDTLINGLNYETIEAQVRETYQNMISIDSRPELSGLVDLLLRHLTIRERHVIQEMFWHGKSQHEVANELHLTRSAVRNYKNRALKKMGDVIVRNILVPKAYDSFKASACPQGFTENPMGERKVS